MGAARPASGADEPIVLRWSTYVGGPSSEAAQAVAAGPDFVTIGGYSFGDGFPTSADAAQALPPGRTDAVATTFRSEGRDLGYSSYLGGSDQDAVHDVAADDTGAVYLVGEAHSLDFPTTPGVVQPVSGGGQDAFIVKLASDGSGVEWATYLGGTDYELAYGADVGPDGSVYVTGRTVSADFPTTPDALRRELLGRSDVYVARLSSDGTRLEYSTLFGGSNSTQRPTSGEAGRAIAVDQTGAAYIAGVTDSSDLPTRSALPPAGRPLGVTFGGGLGDAFAAKIVPGEAEPAWSGYLGGSFSDSAGTISVDASGVAYVGGGTDSPDFPVFLARQPVHGGIGGFDGWLTRIERGGAGMGWSTFLGGNGRDAIADVEINDDGTLWLAGGTSTATFPTTPDALQAVNGGGASDGFLLRLASDGTAVLYGTFLGGSGWDDISGIARVADNIVIAAGYTDSNNFPVTFDSFQPASAGNGDAFVASIGPPLPPMPEPTCRPPGRPSERPPHGSPPGKPC